MRWLYVLRHAESDWNDPRLADFDRPLTPQGAWAAPLIGAYMRRHGLVPDLALCSAARRARETFDRVAAELGGAVPVRFLRELYGAGPAELLRLVRQTPDDIERLLLVGHNPTVEQLVAALASDGDRAAIDRLRAMYPTAALAVLAFESGGWAALAEGGRLALFVTPADLA